MAMKDNAEGLTNFNNFPGIDPAVQSLLGQVQRRQVEAHLPKNERYRKKKERERTQRRKPNRINLDLPQDLKKRLEVLAKREGVPISQLVAFLLLEPVDLLKKRVISLWGYKTASRCPKFECNINLKQKAEEVARK